MYLQFLFGSLFPVEMHTVMIESKFVLIINLFLNYPIENIPFYLLFKKNTQ